MKPSEPECSPNAARMQPNKNSLGPTAATQALSDRIIWKLVHWGTNNDNKLIISRPSKAQWDFPWASLMGFRIMKPNEAERSPKKPKETQTGQIMPFEAHCHPLKPLETEYWSWMRPNEFLWPLPFKTTPPLGLSGLSGLHSASLSDLSDFIWLHSVLI